MINKHGWRYLWKGGTCTFVEYMMGGCTLILWENYLVDKLKIANLSKEKNLKNIPLHQQALSMVCQNTFGELFVYPLELARTIP